MDWTIEVGKFYECSEHRKWECLHIHENVAFMFDVVSRTHGLVQRLGGFNVYMCPRIIGPWIEPLTVKWECLAPCVIGIEVNVAGIQAFPENRFINLVGDNSFIKEAADFYAPDWREHVGEIHYRDGRIERKNHVTEA